MSETYVAPQRAVRKLKAARSLSQTVYVHGAVGFGKTELVRRCLGTRAYRYVTCADGAWEPGLLEGDPSRAVVVDDAHLLADEACQREVIALARREGTWLVVIGRGALPPWLMEHYVQDGCVVVGEDDLRLDAAGAATFLAACDVRLEPGQLDAFARDSYGNPLVMRFAARLVAEGVNPGPQLREQASEAFADYLEQSVLVQWEPQLLEHLMQLSVVDSFDVALAEMITGSAQIPLMLDQALRAGAFLFKDGDEYRLRPVALRALRKRAAKVYGAARMREYAYNAGLCYEMRDRLVEALALYEAAGSDDRIRELLVRNARRNPGNGHYLEFRSYYLRMDEADIARSPVLMAGMSMLHSLTMRPDESERWYGLLRAYERVAQGGDKREAQGRLAYLDIALPHRGSGGVFDAMKRVGALVRAGIELPEFSVTSNAPSVMNGGKDFCRWSKHDRELAATMGPLVERVLGRYGRGLVSAALGESLYEKGGDTYQVLALLTRARMEADGGGVPEIAFASVGLQARLSLACGDERAAEQLLDSFEATVRAQGAVQLLPNLEALRCRVRLRQGDRDAAARWMAESAPDEDREFLILERYRYLTKVRCYLAVGEHLRACALAEKLRFYAERYDRPYIGVEAGVLMAAAKQRMGQPWKDDLLAAVRAASEYGFVRLIGEEGAAVSGLLAQIRKECAADDAIDATWFARLSDEAESMALRYPAYLRGTLADASDFSERALSILRLQAAGLSVSQIGLRLGMKPDAVRYHVKENYRKLEVFGKAEAVLAARNLGLL